MKRLLTLMIIMCFVSFMKPTQACTNFLITPGASVDGSSMISYAADSHVLFGELYHYHIRQSIADESCYERNL